MKVPTCSICEQPVLELRGQYEVLQGYYAETVHVDPALAIAGWCHFPCLSSSEHLPRWHEWQLKHFTTTRGYELLGETDGWTVLRLARSRELFALHADGTTIDARREAGSSAGFKCEGGLLFPVDEEYNLELDDESIIQEIKDSLQKDGQYSVTKLYQDLGLEDKIRWPRALEKACFRQEKRLTRGWGRFSIAMRAVYHSFLPEPILPYWKQLE